MEWSKLSLTPALLLLRGTSSRIPTTLQERYGHLDISNQPSSQSDKREKSYARNASGFQPRGGIHELAFIPQRITAVRMWQGYLYGLLVSVSMARLWVMSVCMARLWL